MRISWRSAFLLLFFAFHISHSQDFGREGSSARMNNLSVKEKVQFINKNFYALYSADFKNAEELASWASQTAADSLWMEEEAYAQKNWGLVLYLSGSYDQVLPHYLKSLSLFEQLQNPKGLAYINNEMAVFYHKQADLENAYKCLDASEKNARLANDLESLGTSLAHRAAFLTRRGKYEEAMPFIQEVYKIRLQTQDSVGLGYVLIDLSELALRKNDLNSALGYLDQSTEIRKSIGDKQGVAVNMVTKGEVYLSVNKLEEAITWLKKGLAEAQIIGYTDLAKFTMGALSDSYAKLNDYKSAFKYKEQWAALNDSLFNVERTKVIQELQTKYETEKKESEIHLLKQENELKEARLKFNQLVVVALIVLLSALVWLGYLLRNRMALKQRVALEETKAELRAQQLQAIIASQEEERRRFAADLHDGLGQLISAVRLNLSKEIPEKRSIGQAVELLNEMNGEIRNIAFNLMPQVLLRSGLKEALDELATRVTRIGTIRMQVSAFDVLSIENTEKKVALYRVCQEWINNVLKYSGCTSIHLQLVQHQDELVITIEDDGNGFDQAQLQKGQGNGWKNIQSRLAMIHGQLELDTQPGRKGTTAIITVPQSIAKAA